MPSSTSSSEPRIHEIHREIPERAWLRMGLAALAITTVALIGWELHVRSVGYAPDYDDTPGIWVAVRKRAEGAKSDQLVLVGASRTLFDLDLDVLQRAFGGPTPVQLATVGSNPMVIFSHLAKDPSFAGTLIVGVVPGLIAVPLDLPVPPNNNPRKYVERYEHWGPAQAWEQPLSLFLQERLAFIQQEDLSLKELSRRIAIPDRPDAQTPPTLPPQLANIDLRRDTKLLARVENDPATLSRVEKIWLRIFTPPPKPPIFSDEQWAKMGADAWNATLAKAKANVEAIRARGGRVIFVNDPSSGALLELEKKLWPRALFWDRLIAETGAPGIHFEDHPELASFTCPEWSHLSARDSVEYSKRLVAVMQRQGLLSPVPAAADRP